MLDGSKTIFDIGSEYQEKPTISMRAAGITENVINVSPDIGLNMQIESQQLI